MFGRLMPFEGRFFELFNALADEIVEAGRELAAMMEKFDDLERRAYTSSSPAWTTSSTSSRVDRRGWRDTEALGRALGHRGTHRLGVDLHHPVRGTDRRGRMVARRTLRVRAAR